MTCVAKFKTVLLLLYALIAGWSITCFLFYYFIYDDIMSQERTNRFSCESDGMEDCPASITRHLDRFQKVLTASVVLLMLLPLVILTLNAELSSSCCRRRCRRTENSESSDFTSPSNF